MNETARRDAGREESAWRVWFLAARPKTLGAALVPVLVGTAVAAFELRSMKAVDVSFSLIAFLSAAAIQVGTNYFNDALDFKKGADTDRRLGPLRITHQGLRSAEQVQFAAWIAFGAALAGGLWLVFQGGIPILIIGLVSLVCGYAYTGGPYPLAYRGLGDLFVLVFFGLVAVGGSAYLQLLRWPASAVVAGAQVGFLAVSLIAINNLRDLEQDVVAGKRTLAVRLGVSGAKLEICACLVTPFLCGLYWYAQGCLSAALLPCLAAPVGIRLLSDVWKTKPSAEYNRFLAKSALLQILFGALFSIGLFMKVLWGF